MRMCSAKANGEISMQSVLAALTELLLIPYVGWGVYNLRRRFRFHDELHPLVEAVSLALVSIYLAIQVQVLEYWFEAAPAYVMFAVLGLFVSAAALYGHMAISLVSWIIVDFMMPGYRGNPDHPRMGPEEALERQRDYEGAIEGYLVLARIYPRNIEIPMRVANNLLRLGRGHEAPTWLERALACCSGGDEATPVVTRLCEVYERYLNDPERARATLEAFLERYPDVKEKEALTEHLGRIGKAIVAGHAAQLTRLADTPLQEPSPPERTEKPKRRAKLDIAPIEGPIAAPESSSASKTVEPKPPKPNLSIEAMGPRDSQSSVSGTRNEDKNRSANRT